MSFDPKNLAIAKRNGAILDLKPGEFVRDGEGERAEFISYGDNAPTPRHQATVSAAAPTALSTAMATPGGHTTTKSVPVETSLNKLTG
jgi:hypothetical protein